MLVFPRKVWNMVQSTKLGKMIVSNFSPTYHQNQRADKRKAQKKVAEAKLASTAEGLPVDENRGRRTSSRCT